MPVPQRQSSYDTCEVTRLLHVPRSRIYSLVRSGVVTPLRSSRHDYRFTFADLVVLRTARDLTAAGVAPGRVLRSLRSLQRQLPLGRPLTSLRIVARGRRVVVQEGREQRDAETGQLLLDFPADTPPADVVPSVRQVAPVGEDTGSGAIDWYEIGSEMESFAPDDAIEAYRQALEFDPGDADAHINLGRMLHERGDIAVAERHYRAALRARPHDVTARYNLGVALEDLGRLPEARGAYQEVVLADPQHADAWFNLAGVLEQIGRKSEAVRCLKAYRALVTAANGDRSGRH